jgi:MGT family glycosyltransferase
MTRRFLIALWPLTGHLLPQLGIGLALRERGHEVAFFSGESVRRQIEQEGFELFPFESTGVEGVEQRLHAMDRNSRRTRPRGRMLPVMREWLVDSIPAQVADIRSVLARWPADAIVSDSMMWGPIAVMWEADGIPVAASAPLLGPLIPGPEAPVFGLGLAPPRTRRGRLASGALSRALERAGAPLWRGVEQMRAQHGLAPMGESVNRFSGRLPLYLVAGIPELDYNRRDLPPSVRYLGNCVRYPEEPGAAGWLAGIPSERPWVYVSESTVSLGDPYLLRTAVAALADEPVELILTTGEQRDPAILGAAASAPNVHVTRWISHGELLPHCAALVTFGGRGVILAAAEAGVPMVVVPTSWDKPDNARRVTFAGAGVRLAPRRLSPQSLRAAVHEVLDRPSYAAAAAGLAAKLAVAPGAAGAAQLLEGMVGGGAPERMAALIDGGAS